MSIVARHYTPADDAVWDDLVTASWNGTFIQTRRYLAYHGDRFRDASLVLEDAHGSPVGVFPAALDPDDERHVVSHPGITYGGIVHRGALRGGQMLAALEAVVETYRADGLRALRYKVVPSIYHRVPSGDDLYALFRLSAVRVRSDLTTTIDLQHRAPPSSRRSRGLKKARRAGLTIRRGQEQLGDFWPVLATNLAEKHGLRPVHSIDEIAYLARLFPDNIDCITAVRGDQVVAGTVLYKNDPVCHAQYIGSSQSGRDISALDFVMEQCINDARESGFRYFNFGVSSESEGRVLNEGLYQFKAEFGGGGITHEFYELTL
jgi:hypothetical protein